MSALLKMEVEQQVYWLECASCGMTFGMLRSWNNRLREEKKRFYCPSGHDNFYSGDGEKEQLRKQLEVEKRRRELAESDATWQRNAARNARIQQTKAQNKLKRITQRVNAGVCPHCNRTFKQLAAHMKSKHPKLAPAADETCDHGVTHA